MKTKNKRKPNLIHALDKDGNWKFINEVPTGIKCNCFCPACKSKLIAINSKPEGESKAHHFAHVNGSDCLNGKETYLHQLAKEILSTERKVMLPIRNGEITAEQLEFDSVEAECRDSETGLIPDCVCNYGNNKLWVEFKRTHEVDPMKASKIRNAKIDCIEIDLNAIDDNHNHDTNKEIFRKYIVDEFENRIWVYDSKTQQVKTWETRNTRNSAEYSINNYIEMDRHIAYDENHYLVNILDVKHEYNISGHRYYCVSCNEELKITENHFEHIVENNNCTDSIYLRNAAMAFIYYRFNTSTKYEISVPQRFICENRGSCSFYDENKCFVNKFQLFDLKSQGYTLCEKNVKFLGTYDIIFGKPISYKDAIVVNVTTEDCQRDYNSSFRQIDIFISNENDVIQLAKNLDGHRHNFKDVNSAYVSPKEINIPISKFSLYNSGKYYLNEVPCTEKDSPRNNQVVCEFLFDGKLPSNETLYLYSLLSCYEKKRRACYCAICGYLKEKICIKYKKIGTPKRPLIDKLPDCDYFSLDIYKANTVRKECENVKLIELNNCN